MELFKASNQWAERPVDERFWSLSEARNACAKVRAQAAAKEVPYRDLRVEALDGEVQLMGRAGVPAKLTNYAFTQLVDRTPAPPARYLRDQPATLAVQNLNWGLKERAERMGESSGNAHLLFHQNGGLMLRAALSKDYKRIWNSEVYDRLITLEQRGWRTPPARPAYNIKDPRARPATEADVLNHSRSQLNGGLAVNVGDIIAPAGVYASDHDMFAFLVNEDRLIDDGRGNALARGAFFWNSEVGDKSLGGMTFLYNAICGNHIVWGAQGVKEFRIRHVGKGLNERFEKAYLQIKEYADGAANEDEARIKASQTIELGKDKTEVLDALLGITRKARIQISEKALGEAYDRATEREDRYGTPNTPWAIVNGLTELSQETPFTDKRDELDRTAGKIMEAVF